MTQRVAFYPLGGGLDQVTPAISVGQGRCIAAVNYEATSSGYRRIDGYERHDGRPSPAAASWVMLSFSTGIAAGMVAGATITGATSGATGVALATATVLTGSYVAGDATGYVGVGGISGTFVSGEQLRVGGSTKATISSPPDLEGSPDDATATTWQATATANARALIAAVPGYGPVRGVWSFGGVVYAFRNISDVSAFAAIYKATSAGWVNVPLMKRLAFTSGGTTQIAVGNTVAGATSGATGLVKSIVLSSGSWAAGTAAGYMVIDAQTGNFAAENLNVGASMDVATVASDSTQITLAAGGRYSFITHNFFGSTGSTRAYAVNGVNLAFEFDGTTLTPIDTGALDQSGAAVYPIRVAAHRGHLFLAFPGGSLQGSQPGEPTRWDGALGAVEIAVGSEITNLLNSSPTVLTVTTEKSVVNLFGNDAADFQLVTLTEEAGVLPWTAEKLGTGMYMDARGVRSINTSQAFGSFNIGTLTQAIRPLLVQKKAAGLTPVVALLVRAKDTYRLIWPDGSGINIFMNKKVPEVMPFAYLFTPYCAASVEAATGEEMIFVGAEDGFVYQLETGDSLDGEAIDYYLRLPFQHLGAPQVRKRWHKINLEVEALPTATLGLTFDLDYGDPDEPVQPETLLSFNGGGGSWEVSSWDQFQWSAPLEAEASAFISGVSKNISFLIAGSSANERPHTIQGVSVFYTVRGLQR